MIFSHQWLREWVDPGMTVEELTEALTMAGLEVDGVDTVARRVSGIVVGEISEVGPHPDADKLSLCKVSDGEQDYQVVCGAPNVRAGMRVPFARPGAEIHVPGEAKPFRIKPAKLRGVESQGMLCSAEELGLEEKSDGLLPLSGDAPLGRDIIDYLDLDDVSIELDLTPNRGDCLGMVGIAREVGVIADRPVSNPEILDVAPAINDEFAVRIDAPDACPRYLGRVIRGVDLDAETPLWMREKLRRAGLRAIDPIVDVTNFVLLELGQPMHAFDLAKLDQHIEVRQARASEKLTLLDGKEVALSEDVLVIADANKAVAMAGIMGGEATAVTDATSDVFLECAFFAPLAVAGRARRFGLHTDASHRYERGVDYELQSRAMERATALLLEIAGGQAGPVTGATGNIPQPERVKLSFANVSRLLGIEMAPDTVCDIFEKLGFDLVERSEQGVTVEVPSFRFDIALEADLIEELARIHGYNNIPRTSGQDHIRLGGATESRREPSRLRHQLVTRGYQEIISYSFVAPGHLGTVCPGGSGHITLQNPISEDMSVMRPSLLPGLLSALAHNLNRQQERLRLFETGLTFREEAGKTLQTESIAGLLYGSRLPNNWSQNKDLIDFFDVKGDVESLLAGAGQARRFGFEAVQHPSFHPGQCAAVLNGEDDTIGHLGTLHPSIQRELGLAQSVGLFELSLQPLLRTSLASASGLSRYPAVSRDLAIVVDRQLPAGQILDLVRENAGEHLAELRIFDVYQGDKVTKNEKSLALGLTWQHPSRTLSDDEINAIISSCINALQEQFNAKLRD